MYQNKHANTSVLCSAYEKRFKVVLCYRRWKGLCTEHPSTMWQQLLQPVENDDKMNEPSETTLKTVQPDIESCNHVWAEYESTVNVLECSVCSHFQEQTKGSARCGKPGGKRPIGQSQGSERNNGQDVTSTTSVEARRSTNSFSSTEIFNSVKTRTYAWCTKCASQNSAFFLQTPPKRPTESIACSPITKYAFSDDCATSPHTKQTNLRSKDELKMPFTRDEDVYQTAHNRTQMSDSADKMSLRCKTGGQPLCFERVGNSRQSSKSASKAT